MSDEDAAPLRVRPGFGWRVYMLLYRLSLYCLIVSAPALVLGYLGLPQIFVFLMIIGVVPLGILHVPLGVLGWLLTGRWTWPGALNWPPPKERTDAP